jgi:Rrf2 family transcriptional regulator, cysteine metabolism repressor
MALSQKCQYSLRALFELARRQGGGPVRAATIAELQDIPARFLEVLLSQLKQGGFVTSRRGREGGYWFVGEPADVTIGRIVRFCDGPIAPVECMTDESKTCGAGPGCAFMPTWVEARKAVSDVYDNTTFQDLVDRDNEAAAPSYDI